MSSALNPSAACLPLFTTDILVIMPCSDCGHIMRREYFPSAYTDVSHKIFDSGASCSRCGHAYWVRDDGNPNMCIFCAGGVIFIHRLWVCWACEALNTFGDAIYEPYWDDGTEHTRICNETRMREVIENRGQKRCRKCNYRLGVECEIIWRTNKQLQPGNEWIGSELWWWSEEDRAALFDSSVSAE